MPNRITSWLKSYITQYKIDFMSLNRLRQNQTVSSTIPVHISHAEKTRMAENLLWIRNHDTSVTFQTMELVRNPYGITPLTALAIFHSDIPCRLSYTVECDSAVPWHFDSMTYGTNHAAPILGLCPNTDNTITLRLYREDGSELANRQILLHTDALPEDENFPVWKDENGTVRYCLAIPACDGKIIPLSDGHFLLVHDKLRTRTESKPLPTHLHEIDLLGRCYRTCYVGDGILHAYGEVSDENHNFLVAALDSKKREPILLELDRNTGAIVRVASHWEPDTETTAVSLNQELLNSIAMDSSEAFTRAGEMLEQIEYPATGWLRPPVFYKAASIETSSAVDLDYMKDTYGISFRIVGDSLMVDTIGDQIQEIVFSRPERIYQLDLTNPPAIDDQYEKYRYTFAVPFTEMHSGTYSVVIRFRDGGQEVLKDTLTLSRRRS